MAVRKLEFVLAEWSTTLFVSVKSCSEQVVVTVVDPNLEIILARHSLD